MIFMRDYSKMSSSSLEIQNSFSAIWTGILLVLPFDTFASATAYIFFADIAHENIWGLMFFTLGLFQLLSVFADVVALRRICAALLAVLFALYVFGVLLANPYSLALSFIAPMIIGQIFAFYQARKVR